MELVYENEVAKVYLAPTESGRGARKPYLVTDLEENRLFRETTEDKAKTRADALVPVAA